MKLFLRGRLTADKHDTEVPTSIVFARLKDFLVYMNQDPFDLLFARNVRLTLGNTPVNVEIRDTFENAPKEFAFSNNGITMLCEDVNHNLASHEVTIMNPRIVNGSQTLHSIREVENSSESARVMVRIIKIPPPNPSDLPTKVAHRKNVIRQISIRSNRQNPIKKWNLVSNDDFQHEIARFFRAKKLYYERRDREWTHRRSELKGLGIGKGPNLKCMAQLIASYYWDQKNLGPVAAKRELGQLFDGKPYDSVKNTSPELTWQLYLIDRILKNTIDKLSSSKRYIRQMAKHMRFVLFSLFVRAMQEVKGDFGSQSLSIRLETEANSLCRYCEYLCTELCRLIHAEYQKVAKKHKKSVGDTLTYANFFKSQSSVGNILHLPLSWRVKEKARLIVNEGA